MSGFITRKNIWPLSAQLVPAITADHESPDARGSVLARRALSVHQDRRLVDTREIDATGNPHLFKQTTSKPDNYLDDSPVHAIPYVEAYFDKFHPSWPFLHRATFDPAYEPPILLQSVLMIGLWVAGGRKLQHAAIELHEKLTTTIHSQRHKWGIPATNHETKPSWPIATYQGILLQIIFALLRDGQSPLLTRKLPEVPAALLTSLVHTCLHQGLFSYPSIIAQFKPGDEPDVFIWLGIEEVKRFALALYKISKIYYTLGDKIHDHGLEAHQLREKQPNNCSSNAPNRVLSLTDLQFGVPDSDSLWNATSNLAATLAARGVEVNSATYNDKNMEANWISNIAQPLQRIDVALFWL
ncbi:hypothetical protein MGYG_02585 [Nannizzia gypsea CBS 118893]|uniref:Xylanolytic transcriptional activator regulatory domain-containing protein n=1 Tax=Arthroderma gypseum (strain ATCC MYA-4604 / CBS 118893) TaxID=535722 RepID=E4UNB2_ARTGP|nr:hypothetical protein MGYG_02585 [Nannizzia gypsea CBS 118893]EFQ99573.1 hypothetical protein MGYG_02585 [Nannizzia gypsea CBS 118893]